MRTQKKKKGKKSGGVSSSSSSTRKGSTCELCAHEDDVPCSASCVKVLESPLVVNATSFQRRSPRITAFYCQCAQLVGKLHRRLQLPVHDNFQEDTITELGSKVLAGITQVLEDTTGHNPDDGNNSALAVCPFVMLLSVLLPSLRKYLAWIIATRPMWSSSTVYNASGGTSPRVTAASVTSGNSGSNNSTLLSMIALHDGLMNVTVACEKVSTLIEANENIEAGAQHHWQSRPAAAAPPAISGLSPSLSVFPQAGNQPFHILQISKISLEFELVYAEFKTRLAELTESILETTELAASRLCRPLVSKGMSKSRGSATEFMELLVLQLLDPIGKCVVASPSPSRVYLFPKVLEACISVTIEEFVVDNAKMNEILAAQFENGVAYLRTWSAKLEIEYNHRLKRALSPRASDDHLVRTYSKERSATTSPPPPLMYYSSNDVWRQKLQLTSLDGFQRFDTILSTWLRGSASKEEETLSARSRMKANLGGLRTTLARTITTKREKM